MDATTIILGIVLIILLYILYKYMTTDNSLLQEYVSLNDKQAPITSLEKAKTPRYAYGLWIYVNEWDSSTEKTIFRRPDNMEVVLDAETASCVVKINTGPDAATEQSIQITDNFPLQKWLHLIVSVDNEYVDCYIDGKLVRSARVYTPATSGGTALLPSIPPEATTGVQLGDDTAFNAYVTKFKRWIYPINPQTAYSEYMAGNGQGWPGMPQFGLDLKLTKDNELYKEVSVF
jgi:hypothetical protein